MWSLLSCCILGTLFTFGSPLECEVCSSPCDSCQGPMVTCGPDEDTCVMSVMEVLLPSGSIKSFGKGCSPSKICDFGISEMNFGDGNRVRVNRVCCTGDSCKKVSPPVLPPVDNKPNGLACPKCFGVFSTVCTETEMACTGSETACIDIAGNLTITGQMSLDVALKGCANQPVCSHVRLGHSVYGGSEAYLTKASCTSPSKAAN